IVILCPFSQNTKENVGKVSINGVDLVFQSKNIVVCLIICGQHIPHEHQDDFFVTPIINPLKNLSSHVTSWVFCVECPIVHQLAQGAHKHFFENNLGAQIYVNL
ncbi:hypothetical protein ACJX0J_021073, partial [Zea mays]